VLTVLLTLPSNHDVAIVSNRVERNSCSVSALIASSAHRRHSSTA